MKRETLHILQQQERSAIRCINIHTKSYLLGVAATLFKLNMMLPSEYVLYCEAVNRSNL